MKNTLTLMLFFASTILLAQGSAFNRIHLLTAEVSNDPAQIELSWVEPISDHDFTHFVLMKKESGTFGWNDTIATLPIETLSYIDMDVTVGQEYEYAIKSRFYVGDPDDSLAFYYGRGYITSGIELELPANRGDFLVVVDSNFIVSLASELVEYQNDLYRDGWMPHIIGVNSESNPLELHERLELLYDSLPNLKTVLFFGHVPIQYGGHVNDDGHPDHEGARPWDGYYTEFDDLFTDLYINDAGATSPRNDNVPGDGKYDNNYFQSTTELQIGRVDFNDLPVYADSEEELLRNYLVKDHDFKWANYVPEDRVIIDGGNFGYQNLYCAAGFEISAQISGRDEFEETDYWSSVNSTDYLWSIGTGGGTYTSVGSLDGTSSLTSAEIAAGYSRSTFSMLFGSYFVDWDVTNALLRVQLAGGKTLITNWGYEPPLHYGHFVMGYNIGYTTWLLQQPNSFEYQAGTGNIGIYQLGDPSLRMKYLLPPTDVNVVNGGSVNHLSWLASADDAILGYNIYRRATDELWVKLNPEIVSDLTFTDLAPIVEGTYEYMLKSVYLEINASGSYYNESLGELGSISHFSEINDPTINSFALFPNPSAGGITIAAKKSIDAIRVVNLLGETVYFEEVTNPAINQNINLDYLSSGTYVVSIQTIDGWFQNLVSIAH